MDLAVVFLWIFMVWAVVVILLLTKEGGRLSRKVGGLESHVEANEYRIDRERCRYQKFFRYLEEDFKRLKKYLKVETKLTPERLEIVKKGG